MNQTKFNDIILVAWAIFLVFNLMGMLYDPSKVNFLLTGFVLGMVIHMLMINPLLNIKDKHIKFLNGINIKLFKEVEELTRKKSNSIKRTKK